MYTIADKYIFSRISKLSLYRLIRLFLVDNDLQKLIAEVVKASNRGVSAVKNATGQSNWSFGQSLFFSSTIVTTIGNNIIKKKIGF